MVSKMSLVEIVGPIGLFDRVVDTVQEAGVLHVEEIPLAEYGEQNMLHRIQLSEVQAQEEKAWEALVRLLDEATAFIPGPILKLLRRLRDRQDQYAQLEQQNVASIATAARILHAKVRSFTRRTRNLTDDMRVLSAYEEIVGALAPVVESRELPQDFEFVCVIFEQKNRRAREMLNLELQKLTAGQCRFFQTTLTKGRTAALAGFHKEFGREARRFIAEAGISEMNVPRYLRDKPFEQAFATLEEDLAGLRRKKQDLQEQKKSFYADKGPLLLAMHQVSRDHLRRFAVMSKFARTSFAFIIKGWALQSSLAGLTTHVADISGGTVIVKEIRRQSQDNPPVLLKNRVPVQPFELLLSFLPLPKYGTIDPTLYIAIFFPPIFGLMLGDVGYGLLIAIAAGVLFLLAKGRQLMRKLATVLGFCAFYAIALGFVFGELFGSLGHELGLKPIWRERFSLGGGNQAEALLGYLAIAVAVGLLHVMFGLILGIINARKTGQRNQAINCAARIVGLFVLFFFVGRLTQLLPPIFTSFGVVALLLFLVLMIYQIVHNPAHGMLLPLEVLGTVGNVLSYARIMAVGMASVVLALLANMLGGMIGNIALAGIVIVLVHALNLALGVIDPTIQGLRLHYVEFFSKFYASGGTPYSPFKKRGGMVA